MKYILQLILLLALALPVFSAETKKAASAALVYSSLGRLRPEDYQDEAKARKLLRERDAKINEIIAERQRLLQKDPDIKVLYDEMLEKYCRVASYLRNIKEGDDLKKAVAANPAAKSLYDEAQKSLIRLSNKIENRKSMIFLSSQLTDIDFEIDRLVLLEKPVTAAAKKQP